MKTIAGSVQTIHKLTSMGVAVMTAERPARILISESISDDRLTQLRSRIDACPNLTQEVSRNATPRSMGFDDGSSFYMLALVHDGIFEGLLCLHGSNTELKPPSEEQLQRFKPLLAAIAAAIPAVLEQEATAQSGASTTIVSPDNSNARSAVTRRLLGNIAHDIRTPATVLRGYIRMLIDGRAGLLSDAQKDCLEFALNAAGKLVVLGETVEDAARATAGLTAETMDLRDLWAGARRANQATAERRSISVSEDFPLHGVSICGDRKAVTSLLEQLLDRALQKAEAGAQLRAAISRDVAGPTLKLCVPLGVSDDPAEGNVPALFSDLAKHFFIHGGTLLCWQKHGESATVTISLPGGQA